MVLYKKIVYRVFVQLIARTLATVSNFIVILLIGKTLGSFGLGQYTKVFAFIGIFSLFVDFGINASFLKIGGDCDIGSLIKLRLLIAGTVFLMIQPLILFLPYNGALHTGFSHVEKLFIELTASVLFLYAVVHSLNALFQKWERFDLFILPNLVYGVTVFTIALYATATSRLIFFFAASLGGLACYCITAFFLVAPRLVRSKPVHSSGQKSFIQTLFAKSLPIGVTLFLNTLYVRADVLILSLLRPTEEVGVYTLAYKFFEFPLSLSFFTMNALYPIFLKKRTENKRIFYHEIKKIAFLLCVFSLVLASVAFFAAPLIGSVKTDFYRSVGPFRILVFSYPFFFLSNLLLWVIIAENKEKILPFVYGASLMGNSILNILFIPRFGYTASAAITVISELGVLLFFFFFLRRAAYQNNSL